MVNNESLPYLTDAFGRKHDYLRLSLTELCNLRCFYCMPAEGIPLKEPSRFMNTNEVFQMAKIFTGMGVKKIRLTGGEPLVRKGVEDVLTSLATLNVELAITTNGILVDKYIDVIKKSNIVSVNVSLDSLQEKKQSMISRRNYFHRIFSNIMLLLQEDFHVKINVVVMKNLNDNELIDFVKLTQDYPVHIRFIEFMPFKGNNWNWNDGIGYLEMMNTISGYFGSNNIVKLEQQPNETAKCHKVNSFKGSFGIISSITNPFCGTCNRIRLTADGRMKNCLFSTSETDLLTPFRNQQDIIPLILRSIAGKKFQRAGMDSMDDLLNTSISGKNRSMVSIGG